MTPETVGVFAAIVFLLIAVVGGGFTVRELSVPTVPTWGRFVAAVLGVLFAVPFAMSLTNTGDGDRATLVEFAGADEQTSDGPSPRGAAGQIYRDDQPETSPESLTLVEVEATAENAEPKVNDRITVTYSLENAGDAPFRLASTFVGARGPGDQWADFGEGNVGHVLQPGGRLTVQSSKIVDEPGMWTFWPCYTFGDEGFCPDEWKAFEVTVAP
jgi:hypothetical protein